ncbi:hypothetical protein CUMW_225780 [Citrus unshiu]|uniref:EF-hand domain-containing protein n=1 Tax=Citrus unshiu TaxID=55188 RepID=A0A2H5QFP5_CITUN|nr:hypothetical protein CUMW_225780 [Citrus unshiu]
MGIPSHICYHGLRSQAGSGSLEGKNDLVEQNPFGFDTQMEWNPGKIERLGKLIEKVGLRFDKNENGIITREEIKNKVEQVLGDQDFEARALELKGKAMNCIREGGSSRKTFQNFLEWVKKHPGT